jgi:hypothetical protein
MAVRSRVIRNTLARAPLQSSLAFALRHRGPQGICSSFARGGQTRREIPARVAAAIARHFFGSAKRHNFATLLTCLRPHLQSDIGGGDNVEMMLNDDY